MLQNHIIAQMEGRVRNTGKGRKYQLSFHICLSLQLDHEHLKEFTCKGKEHGFTNKRNGFECHAGLLKINYQFF